MLLFIKHGIMVNSGVGWGNVIGLDGAGVCLDKADGEASVWDLVAIHSWWTMPGYDIASHELYTLQP